MIRIPAIALIFVLSNTLLHSDITVRISSLTKAIPTGWEIELIKDNAVPKDYEHVKDNLPKGIYISINGPIISNNDSNVKIRGLKSHISLWLMPVSFNENSMPEELKSQSQSGAAIYVGSNKNYKLFMKSYLDRGSYGRHM